MSRPQYKQVSMSPDIHRIIRKLAWDREVPMTTLITEIVEFYVEHCGAKLAAAPEAASKQEVVGE